MKKRKANRTKKDRSEMAKFSVCLPSVSVLGHIGRYAGLSGRTEASMAAWLLEAATAVAFKKPHRRLMPKKKWKLKNKSSHIRFSIRRELSRRMSKYIYQFCSKEHLTVGGLVQDMLLVGLEAFQRLSPAATSDQLVEEIRRTYLKNKTFR